MGDELSYENYFPYLARSRTVTRLPPQPIFPHSPVVNPEIRYGPEFWDRLMRQPSHYDTKVPGSVSSYETWRTSARSDRTAQPVLSALPPPSEVFKGKKKKKSPAMRSVVYVENYMKELRKKQSSIDQLKTMKWGGSRTYPLWNNKASQMDGGRDEQELDTSSSFFSSLDDKGRFSEQDGPIFTFSPPCSPGGVVFPRMSPHKDFSTCFLDGSSKGVKHFSQMNHKQDINFFLDRSSHEGVLFQSPPKDVSTCFLGKSSNRETGYPRMSPTNHVTNGGVRSFPSISPRNDVTAGCVDRNSKRRMMNLRRSPERCATTSLLDGSPEGGVAFQWHNPQNDGATCFPESSSQGGVVFPRSSPKKEPPACFLNRRSEGGAVFPRMSPDNEANPMFLPRSPDEGVGFPWDKPQRDVSPRFLERSSGGQMVFSRMSPKNNVPSCFLDGSPDRGDMFTWRRPRKSSEGEAGLRWTSPQDPEPRGLAWGFM
ncbi:protein INCA1 [Engystomops pustulosus]|uniref:protein INCA1 n=1 Tax=Engystomops pustulosus TaxID=76066 RepID=UPI003AFAEB52